MTSLQLQLLLSWLVAISAAIFIAVAGDWPHLWLFVSGLSLIAMLVEPQLLRRIYSVAPTPLDFFSERPVWKRYAVWYGLLLSAAAFSMLTFAQGVARGLGESPPLLFSVIFGPLLIPVLAHQLAVYKALSREPDA